MSNDVQEQTNSMIANLKEKTGRSSAEWMKVLAPQKLEKHGQIVKFLKSEHGVTHGFANLIAHLSLNSSSLGKDDSDLVDAQYSGPKADLKPIYDKILKSIKGFGKDLEIAPKKTYVSLRHKKQFGLVQPSTKTRVDLGINLKGKKPTGRLEASGSFNAMVSHRVRLESAKDVDAEVIGWLKEAFEAAG